MSLGPKFALTSNRIPDSIIDDQISIFQYRIIRNIEATVLAARKDIHETMNTTEQRKPTKRRKQLVPKTCREYTEKFMTGGKWRTHVPDLEDTIATMRNRIMTSISKVRSTPNLTKKERKCVQQLSRQGKVVLLNSDKSMGPVAMSKNLFIEECFVHLYDKVGTYILLGHGKETKEAICNELESKVRELMNAMKGVAGFQKMAATYGAAAIDAARQGKLATCYVIPKLHKTPIASRLIVPAYDTVAAPLADFLHDTLFDEVAKHRYVLRDTNQLIQQLELANSNGLAGFQILVTADVTALYPSIELEHGLKALRMFMERLYWPETKISNIIKIAEFVLTHNIIEFPLSEENPIFKQVIGTAMGVSFSVCYAIIFMIWFEDPLILEAIRKGYLKQEDYNRFIDDLAFLWSGPRDALASLMEKFDNKLPNIKFTWSATPAEVRAGTAPQRTEFMDIAIWKEENKWKFKIARKANAAFAYLHPTSCHPEACYKGWIKAEVLRILTHSSNLELAREEIARFQENLIRRGYDRETLPAVCSTMNWEDRSAALWGTRVLAEQPRITPKRIFCTVPYSQQTRKISRELRIHEQSHIEHLLPRKGTASFCVKTSLGAMVRGKRKLEDETRKQQGQA